VLRELRSTRRRRLVGQIDVMEVLYRVYVAAIFGGVALALIAGAVNEADITPGTVADIGAKGPALLGLAIAFAVLAGLRSGARGGPLAIEAAEVQYTLLAPLPRRLTLRATAWRQLRTALIAGAVFGLIVGNFAFRRLPGSPVEWLACLAAFGAAVPLCGLGSALVACGRRVGPRLAAAIGLLVVAWSLIDVLAATTTSPATMLGLLATLPLQHGSRASLSAIGLVLALSICLAGLAGLGGLSLEAARRRATLAAELRFSASVQDVRTVVLLRRQLSSERARRRPWLRFGGQVLATRPVPRRALRSFLRWPPARILRVLLVGALAGVIATAAWAGATPLALLVGAVLMVAALDLVEPLAQEVDHPLRRDLVPVGPEALIQAHLLVPAAAMAGVVLVGALAALALGAAATAIGVGVVMAVPSGLVLLACAAVSATNDPYQYVLSPQLGYVQTAAPLVVAMVAVGAPLLLARAAADSGDSPVLAAFGPEVFFLLVGVGGASWMARRVAKRTAVAP
jgi:hypothetical protein